GSVAGAGGGWAPRWRGGRGFWRLREAASGRTARWLPAAPLVQPALVGPRRAGKAKNRTMAVRREAAFGFQDVDRTGLMGPVGFLVSQAFSLSSFQDLIPPGAGPDARPPASPAAQNL